MKKRILKSLILGLMIVNLLPLAEANASTVEQYITPYTTITATSDQWVKSSTGWMLATPSKNQAYSNTWALVDGKWYYLNEYGSMYSDIVAIDSSTQKKYYLQSDGSLLVNSNYEDGVHKYYADSNGELQITENKGQQWNSPLNMHP